ncbi:MAG: ribokinase [Ruminococcaceae bacterium]|nr:ribokinase [Oscillospiraceae bacterium]
MKFLNFGSLNIDYVYSVDHFVRAGETIASSEMNLFCGGKGLNQSMAFAKAGAEVYHAGRIGKEGGMLKAALDEAGVNTSLVRVSENVACGHAIIQVTPSGENSIMLYGGANRTIDKIFVDEVLSKFSAGDVIVLQNEISSLSHIISVAKKKGLITVLNPSPFNNVIGELDLSLIDYLIINETEGKELTRLEAPRDIIGALRNAYPETALVLTLGKDGAIYSYKNEYAEHPIFKVRAVDTTAAGDTFTGFFFSELFGGASPYSSLRFACAASAISVSRKGASPSIPTRAEVVDFLNSESHL